LSVDRQLAKAERAEVSSLSSRAHVTARRADFIYHAEGYDISGGWEQLMARYYDAMYSESYDWWTLALAFDAGPDKCALLRQYEFSGVDDLGVDVSETGLRVIVTISCRIDMAMIAPDNYGYYDDCDDAEDEADDIDAGGTVAVTGDELLDLLVKIRKQISELKNSLSSVRQEACNNPSGKPKRKSTKRRFSSDLFEYADSIERAATRVTAGFEQSSESNAAVRITGKP